MARPKSYDRDEVIGRVRDAFWKSGYQGLGIRAIEEETGLGRFAIRTEFGGKEGLMAEALKVYSDDAETYVYSALRASDDVETIVDVLDGMVSQHPDTLRHYGCLMVNTTIENASLESDVLREATDNHFAVLRRETKALIERAQAAGHARADVDPEAAAAFVCGSVMAIMVMNRAAADASGGAVYASEAKKAIRAWGN